SSGGTRKGSRPEPGFGERFASSHALTGPADIGGSLGPSRRAFEGRSPPLPLLRLRAPDRAERPLVWAVAGSWVLPREEVLWRRRWGIHSDAIRVLCGSRANASTSFSASRAALGAVGRGPTYEGAGYSPVTRS